MKQAYKLERIKITARRWQDSSGNTYYSARVVVNGALTHEEPFSYGYGDHYLHDMGRWLDDSGLLPDPLGDGCLWRYCEDHGISLEYSAANVERKKDM